MGMSDNTPRNVTQELLGLARYASGAKPSRSVVIDRLQRVVAGLKGPRPVTAARKYSNNPSRDASEIAAEVVYSGRSRGWSGDIEQLEQLEEMLGRFNIGYTDDMYGDWEYVKGGTQTAKHLR